MSRCARDKKGRFAKHDIKRSVMQWKCVRCGLVVPTILLAATRNIVNIKRMVACMNEENSILGVG